jgi:hypothetical protein
MRQTFALVLFVFSATLPLSAAEITATVGKQMVVIPDGKYDFHYFPDEPISVISRQPLRFLVVVSNRTILMQGRSFETAKPIKAVLEPSGSSGSYDQKYAGISSIYVHKKRDEILGFFHAEKQTGRKTREGNNCAYATIGLAISTDGGRSFKKVGPILTGKPEDPEWTGPCKAMPTFLYAPTTQANGCMPTIPNIRGETQPRARSGASSLAWHGAGSRTVGGRERGKNTTMARSMSRGWAARTVKWRTVGLRMSSTSRR